MNYDTLNADNPCADIQRRCEHLNDHCSGINTSKGMMNFAKRRQYSHTLKKILHVSHRPLSLQRGPLNLIANRAFPVRRASLRFHVVHSIDMVSNSHSVCRHNFWLGRVWSLSRSLGTIVRVYGVEI